MKAAGVQLMAQGEVQVWVLHAADVPACASALVHTLSADERARAGRYRAEVHRQRFIARRGMLRWLSARYLGCSPHALRWEVEDGGKPLWRQPVAPRLAFSLSQTESMALLAFAWDCRVGVDVQQELADVDFAGVGQAVFSAAEQAALAGAGGDAGAEFFRLWSRKEALLKAVGTGLSEEARSYTTQQAEDQRGRGEWRASHRGVPIAGWTFLDLAPGPGVKAALAVSHWSMRVSLCPCPLPLLVVGAQGAIGYNCSA